MSPILVKLALFLGLLVSGVAAVAIAPPEGCRLTIKNTGTADNPVYAFDCVGDCVAPATNPCAAKSLPFVGENGQPAVIWFCQCDGQDITVLSNQACDANANNEGGAWKIVCSKAQCTNDCTKASLPVAPGSTVYACSCPDV